jgi:hypothetical protein
VRHEGEATMKIGRDRSLLAGIAVGCAALLIGMIALLVITPEPAGFHAASNDPPAAGASGLARPHEPLDRAPGEPLEAPFVGENVPGAQVRSPVRPK